LMSPIKIGISGREPADDNIQNFETLLPRQFSPNNV
jgi:hypothetical protein